MRPRLTAVGLLLLIGILWAAREARAQGGPKPDNKAKGKSEVEPRDYYFLREDLVRNKDGTVTLFYVTNHVGAQTLKKSLSAWHMTPACAR
jgi:hypothetical protein